jgi:alpha-beta hydrolase superfamily lysophospholipase
MAGSFTEDSIVVFLLTAAAGIAGKSPFRGRVHRKAAARGMDRQLRISDFSRDAMKGITGSRRTPIALRIAATCLLAALVQPLAAQSAGLDSLWQAYVDDLASENLQRGCNPVRIDPPPATARLGVALLYHGFAACPQEWFGIAELLSANGYTVLLPVLPGHGREYRYLEEGENPADGLPDSENWQDTYAALAVRLNTVMANANGERVIGGFSLGGAMAIYAQLDAPDLYERALLVAPFFHVAGGPVVRYLTTVLAETPTIDQMQVRFGPLARTCTERQRAGWAGLCTYQLEHFAGIRAFAENNERLLAEKALQPAVQIVVGEDDPVVSVDHIDMLTVRHDGKPDLHSCLLDEDAPHVLLSPEENPGEEMPWLPGLTRGAVDFLAHGQFFPTIGVDNRREGLTKRCRL